MAWDLDHAAATWRERSLALGADDPGEAPAMEMEQQEAAEETAMDEEEWRVVRNELKLDDTGEKKTLHGFACRRYLLTWLVEAENLQTKERRTNRMTGDFWSTPVKGAVRDLQDQERAFNAAYLKQLGLEMSPEQMGRFGLNLLGSLVAASSDELQQTLGRMEGYPIVAAITWQATEPAGDDQEEAGGLDLSQGVGSALGGLFGKKLKEVATGKKKEGEMRTVFDSRTEIVAIDTAAIAPVQFEIPRSYSRRD